MQGMGHLAAWRVPSFSAAEQSRAVQSAEVGVLLVPLIMEAPMQDAMVVESPGPRITRSQRMIPCCHEMPFIEALFCRSLPFSLSVQASAPLDMLNFADAMPQLDEREGTDLLMRTT